MLWSRKNGNLVCEGMDGAIVKTVPEPVDSNGNPLEFFKPYLAVLNEDLHVEEEDIPDYLDASGFGINHVDDEWLLRVIPAGTKVWVGITPNGVMHLCRNDSMPTSLGWMIEDAGSIKLLPSEVCQDKPKSV